MGGTLKRPLYTSNPWWKSATVLLGASLRHDWRSIFWGLAERWRRSKTFIKSANAKDWWEPILSLDRKSVKILLSCFTGHDNLRWWLYERIISPNLDCLIATRTRGQLCLIYVIIQPLWKKVTYLATTSITRCKSLPKTLQRSSLFGEDSLRTAYKRLIHGARRDYPFVQYPSWFRLRFTINKRYY